MRAIVICSQEEKKLVMTGREGGATAEAFTDYIIETLKKL
jgi:isocitrate dehydrogenase (NAD+)